MIAVTSAISVLRSSCVRLFPFGPNRTPSKTLRVTLVILPYILPMWEEWGELNIYFIFDWSMKCITSLLRFSVARMKFVLRSDRSSLTLSRRAINFRNALINDELDMEYSNSMWTALVVKHVNIIANQQHLLWFCVSQSTKCNHSYDTKRMSRSYFIDNVKSAIFWDIKIPCNLFSHHTYESLMKTVGFFCVNHPVAIVPYDTICNVLPLMTISWKCSTINFET